MAQQKFFGPPPKTPFALPGVYITPEGGVSAAGAAFRRGGVGETQAQQQARQQQAREAARLEAQRKAREEAARKLEAQRLAKLEAQRKAQQQAQRKIAVRRAVKLKRPVTEFFPGVRIPEKEGLLVRKDEGEMFAPFVERRKPITETVEEIPEPEEKISRIKLEQKEEIKLEVTPEVEAIRKITIEGDIPPIPSEALISRELVVSPVKREIGLIPSVSKFASEQRSLLQAETGRGEASAKSIALGLGIGALASVSKTAEFGVALVKEPAVTTARTIKAIPEIPKRIGELGIIIRGEPAFVTGYVGAELIQMKAIGKALKQASRIGEQIRARISPRYKALRIEKGREFFEVPRKIKGEPPLRIEVARPVKKITEKLSKQVKLAGKKGDVVSAQTMKKFLGKEGFKFGRLERELFFDPYGRLRISRLGVISQKEAKLLDILSGEIAFREGKRIALIGEKFPIEAFPKSLKDIEKALRLGKPLTKSQILRFEIFKKIPSGKFKPIGKLTREPEVILPAGEFIKEEKILGVTLIKGRRVELIRPQILTTKDISKILKTTTPSTKDISKISSVIETRPFVSLPRLGISAGVSLAKLSKDVSRIAGISKKIISPVKPSKISLPKITKDISKLISPRISKMGISPRVYKKFISPRISIPKYLKQPIIPAKPIPLPSIRRRKRKKIPRRKRKGYEDIAISEGFVARIAQLKPIKIKRKKVRELAEIPARPLGIRRIPQILD